MRQFMIEFRIPQPMTEEFAGLIPAQRARVSELMAEGRMLNYSLSMDRAKLWTVMVGESSASVRRLVRSLPLTPYMEWEMSELMFHNALSLAMPAVSMN
jgi:muconolactone delta-isomerase